LPVLATNGRVFHLEVVEVRGFLKSRRFLGMLIVFCTLLAVVDQFVFQKSVLLPWRMAFWITNGVFIVMFWYLLFRLLIRGRRAIGLGWPIPSAVMIILSVIGLVCFNYWLAGVILGQSGLWRGRLLGDVFRHSAVAIIFETGIAIFVLPRALFAMRRSQRNAARADETRSTTEAVGGQRDFLDVSGKKRELASILYLKSAEHYVEVVLHDATELVRASLREMVDILHPSSGVQPHRSFWVNRDAIVGMNRVNGAQFLVLSNGEEIPVSRQRRGEVDQWLNTHVRKKGPG